MTTQTINYGTPTAITFTSLASLASSSTFTAGGESNAVDNSSNKFDDVEVSGYISVGTTPSTLTQILVYAFAALGGRSISPAGLGGIAYAYGAHNAVTPGGGNGNVWFYPTR